MHWPFSFHLLRAIHIDQGYYEKLQQSLVWRVATPRPYIKNQDTLVGEGQVDPPPLNPMFEVKIWQIYIIEKVLCYALILVFANKFASLQNPGI